MWGITKIVWEEFQGTVFHKGHLRHWFSWVCFTVFSHGDTLRDLQPWSKGLCTAPAGSRSWLQSQDASFTGITYNARVVGSRKLPPTDQAVGLWKESTGSHESETKISVQAPGSCEGQKCGLSAEESSKCEHSYQERSYEAAVCSTAAAGLPKTCGADIFGMGYRN